MMQSFLKLYPATFLFILALTSFGLAGNGQCPADPLPPPPTGEGYIIGNISGLTIGGGVFGAKLSYINDFLKAIERGAVPF